MIKNGKDVEAYQVNKLIIYCYNYFIIIILINNNFFFFFKKNIFFYF